MKECESGPNATGSRCVAVGRSFDHPDGGGLHVLGADMSGLGVAAGRGGTGIAGCCFNLLLVSLPFALPDPLDDDLSLGDSLTDWLKRTLRGIPDPCPKISKS
jgi:hypothetical protein